MMWECVVLVAVVDKTKIIIVSIVVGRWLEKKWNKKILQSTWIWNLQPHKNGENGEKCQKLFCWNDKKNPDGGGGSLPYFQTEPVPIIILCVIIIMMMMMVSHIFSKNDIQCNTHHTQNIYFKMSNVLFFWHFSIFAYVVAVAADADYILILRFFFRLFSVVISTLTKILIVKIKENVSVSFWTILESILKFYRKEKRSEKNFQFYFRLAFFYSSSFYD